VCEKRKSEQKKERENKETRGGGGGERGKTNERERERGKQRRRGGGREVGFNRKYVCVHVYVSVSSFWRIIACVCTHVCARVDIDKMQGGKKWGGEGSQSSHYARESVRAHVCACVYVEPKVER